VKRVYEGEIKTPASKKKGWAAISPGEHEIQAQKNNYLVIPS